jgi:hypothetical protein
MNDSVYDDQNDLGYGEHAGASHFIGMNNDGM